MPSIRVSISGFSAGAGSGASCGGGGSSGCGGIKAAIGWWSTLVGAGGKTGRGMSSCNGGGGGTLPTSGFFPFPSPAPGGETLFPFLPRLARALALTPEPSPIYGFSATTTFL